MSRVQAFLPQLKNANEQLDTSDLSKLNIENVEEEEGQYIEMVIYHYVIKKNMDSLFLIESRSWCL